jgi:hypothetical protein
MKESKEDTGKTKYKSYLNRIKDDDKKKKHVRNFSLNTMKKDTPIDSEIDPVQLKNKLL